MIDRLIGIDALGRQGAWGRSGLLKVLASRKAGEGDATAADHADQESWLRNHAKYVPVRGAEISVKVQRFTAKP